MVTEFCNKFLEEEGALHIMDLGRVIQKPGEGLVNFIKRYRDKALHCKETLPEADLVYGCIKNVEDGAQIFLALSEIATFAELLRKGADVAEAMKRQGKHTKDDAAFDTFAVGEREKKKNYKAVPPPRKYSRESEPLKLPISKELTYQLVEEWFKEGLLRDGDKRRPPTTREKEDPNYCVVHRDVRSNGTMECYVIRRIFHARVREGKLLLPEGAREEDLQTKPLPDHTVNAIIGLGDVTMEDAEVLEAEEDGLEEILQRGIAKTRGFRILFAQLKLGERVQQEATQALTEVIMRNGGTLCTVNAPLTRMAKAQANAIVFKEPIEYNQGVCHNKPLYVEAYVEGARVRRALIDNGARVNIIPSHIFQALSLPRDKLQKSTMRLNAFNGASVRAIACVALSLEVGPTKTTNMFQIVDGEPNYHILLGRPWIHQHQCVPSTLHQVVKSNFRGKDIEIRGIRAPVEATESHTIEATAFDELASPRANVIRPPQWVGFVPEREGNQFKRPCSPEKEHPL